MVIKAGENPAYRILRKIQENKERHNIENYSAYEYEVYDRMQFDLNNFDKEFTDKKILVIGATGNVGAEIVKQLSAHQVSIIGATRSPGRQVASKHLTWKAFQVEKAQDLSSLFEAVDSVFLMSPAGYAEQDKVLAPLIEAAQQSKVQKVVMMTAIGVDASDEIPLRKAELQLQQSGLSYAIIRPNWFNQNFQTFWRAGIMAENKIMLPAGMAKTSFIDIQDIAACAVSLLISDQSENQAYLLTGPQALNYQDAADLISSVSGQDIRYQDTDPQVFKQSLLQAQLPADYANILVGLFDFVRAGYVSRVSNDVEQLIGRPPIAFKTYAESAQSFWKEA